MQEKLKEKTNVGALLVRNTKKNLPNCAQKGNKGITLVALIITIIVLLILAVVAIRAVQGDGIIAHAKNAQIGYEKAQEAEQIMLESYLGTLEADKVATTMEEAQKNTMLSKTKNSEITDRYGNKIVVPAGFKILVDSTTNYTEDDIDVTKGIVIQDTSGNEFVWVPVGKIYTDKARTEENAKTIELKRYVFNDADGTINESLTQTEPNAQLKPISSISFYYTEGLKDEITSNAHAKDIVAFKTSAETNHGYYIGRYEAGVSGYDETATNNNTQGGNKNWTKYKTAEGNDPQLVCKSNQQVWDYVTQKKASELCMNMYSNKPYESDLINSYAWDTALMFIQTFGTEEYASVYSITSIFEQECIDKYRNIYNMSNDKEEWSTETCNKYSDSFYVSRGGMLDYGNIGIFCSCGRAFNSR